MLPGMEDFAERLIAWQRRCGRRDLPWQGSRDPYRIWISEIMLQQTQVAAVIPYYLRFIERFPDVACLARAEADEVAACWSGLGYYARARHLHAAARRIMDEMQGKFPLTAEALVNLPGIGRSTAAAIAVFATGAHEAILDGNVRRVLARHRGIEGWPGQRQVEARLWQLAQALMPHRGIEAYTQGLMDLGATVCLPRVPRCGECPLQSDCMALAQQITHRLPAPRPARPPRREHWWLVQYRHAGEIWLSRRPARGIWGGLWCFDQLAQAEDFSRLCHEQWGVAAQESVTGERFIHVLTHRLLEIVPVRVELAQAPQIHRNGRWLSSQAAAALALPAPVRRLLDVI